MSKNNDARRSEIERLILDKQTLQVEELSSILGVSLETIRNDLSYLEKKGILYRTHGGAKLRNSNIDIPMEIRLQENILEKKAIAQEVIKHIKNDDILYIDPSSTALHVAKYLKLRKNLTIVTNSLELILLLHDSKHNIIMVGGAYCQEGRRCSGNFSLHIIESIHFDLCILGMDGCKNSDGPNSMDADEVLMNKHVMDRSDKVMIVSDASKFKKKSNYQYTKFESIDILISGTLDQEDRERIRCKQLIEV